MNLGKALQRRIERTIPHGAIAAKKHKTMGYMDFYRKYHAYFMRY